MIYKGKRYSTYCDQEGADDNVISQLLSITPNTPLSLSKLLLSFFEELYNFIVQQNGYVVQYVTA